MNLPEGEYDGQVLGRLRFLNHIWTGKVFTDATVTNKILGLRLFKGKATRDGHVVFIDYPQLHLTDVLIPASGDDTRWDGSMALGPFVVQFTLTKRKDNA